MYAKFCAQFGRTDDNDGPLVDETTLHAFVAYAMSEEGLSWSDTTVRIALTAISTDCVRRRMADPMAAADVRTRLQDTIKGASKEEHQRAKARGARKNKLPLTPHHLTTLLERHQGIIEPTERRVFPAFALAAVITMARSGNLLARTLDSFDPSSTLALADVQLGGGGSRYDLLLRRTKTRVAGMTVSIAQGTRRSRFDPWSVFHEYRTWRIATRPRRQTSPFFILEDGTTYTTSRATGTLRQLLAANGDDPTKFSLHGLRHGGSTALISQGAAACEVLSLGGWRSPQMLNTYANRISAGRGVDLLDSMTASKATFENAGSRNGPRGPRGGRAAGRL